MCRFLHSFCLWFIAVTLPLCGAAAAEPDMLVLMSESGRVERCDMVSGAHVGTLLNGLPPSDVLPQMNLDSLTNPLHPRPAGGGEAVGA